jgi:hypothetical protein
MATYTWDFGSVAEGLAFTIVFENGTFTVTVTHGSMNLNALYWTDGDSTANEGGGLTGFTGAKSENSLNMNGTGEVWDGGIKISDAGLGKTPPDSYIVAGSGHDSFTIDAANFDPANFGTLGVRATSTSTESGSIKWVEDPVEPEDPADDFPTWPQDISNIVLYFDQDAGDTKPGGGDGFYLVKIDGVPPGADDDLDQWIDDALAWLIANDPNIDANSDLLGAAIKGGNDAGSTQFYAYGDHNTNGTDPDPVPAGAPDIETPPAQGQVPGNEIDKSYDYDVVFA